MPIDPIRNQNEQLVIPVIEVDLDNIQKLDDEPNDVGGLSAAQLKAEFDRAGDSIKEYINGTLVPALSDTVAERSQWLAKEGEISAAETGREEAEAGRVQTEADRVQAEADRVAAEDARVIAEQARADAASGYVRQAEAAKEAAEGYRDGAMAVQADIQNAFDTLAGLIEQVDGLIGDVVAGVNAEVTVPESPGGGTVVEIPGE